MKADIRPFHVVTPAAEQPSWASLAAAETMRQAGVLQTVKARISDTTRGDFDRLDDVDRLRIGVHLFRSRLEHNHNALEVRDARVAAALALVELGVFSALGALPDDRHDARALARATSFGVRLLK